MIAGEKKAKGKTARKNHNLSRIEYAAQETKHSLFVISVMAFEKAIFSNKNLTRAFKTVNEMI